MRLRPTTRLSAMSPWQQLPEHEELQGDAGCSQHDPFPFRMPDVSGRNGFIWRLSPVPGFFGERALLRPLRSSPLCARGPGSQGQVGVGQDLATHNPERL